MVVLGDGLSDIPVEDIHPCIDYPLHPVGYGFGNVGTSVGDAGHGNQDCRCKQQYQPEVSLYCVADFFRHSVIRGGTALRA